MAIIRITTKGGKTSQRKLESEKFRIGRSSQNDLQMPSDPALSRFHAEIHRKGEDFSLTDLGSRNGTFLNGVRLQGSNRLKAGDRISLGETEIMFNAAAVPSVTMEDTSAPTDTTSFPLEDILQPAGWEKPQVKTGPTEELASATDAISILTNAGRELVRHRPLNEVFEVIMDLIFQAIPAERGCLMLQDKETGELVAKSARNSGARTFEPITLSKTIARSVMENKDPVLAVDATMDPRFQEQKSIVLEGIHSAMCVPLWNNKEVMGLIYLDTKNPATRFSKEEVRLLTLLANIAAVKIENEQLTQDSIRKKQLEEDYNRAAEIQQAFLPSTTPDFPGFEILGQNIPCEAVGGDYFDLIPSGEYRLLTAIGDVCGKGMPAALLMSNLHATLHAWVELKLSLPDLVGRLNQAVLRAHQINRFISFFVGVIDRKEGTLAYCNAGHNPPFLIRSGGKVERLPATGIPLGILEDGGYSDAKVSLETNDLILMFSDGLTESVNKKEEQYGEKRLEEFLLKHRSKPIGDIHEKLHKSLEKFTGGSPQQDDLTLVLVKRT